MKYCYRSIRNGLLINVYMPQSYFKHMDCVIFEITWRQCHLLPARSYAADIRYKHVHLQKAPYHFSRLHPFPWYIVCFLRFLLWKRGLSLDLLTFFELSVGKLYIKMVLMYILAKLPRKISKTAWCDRIITFAFL